MKKKKKIIVRPRKCPVTKKSMFNNQSQASRALGRIISHDPGTDMFDLHTYICPSCGAWHVGHKSYYEMSLAK